MRAYVKTTGVLFGLLVVVHIWKVIDEGAGPAKDPFFVGFTILAVGLVIWAWRVLRVQPRA